MFHTVRVSAFGCADLTHVANAWIRRTGNTVMVRCNLTGETYFLTCRNSAWKGELYNCSQSKQYIIYTFILTNILNGFHRNVVHEKTNHNVEDASLNFAEFLHVYAQFHFVFLTLCNHWYYYYYYCFSMDFCLKMIDLLGDWSLMWD